MIFRVIAKIFYIILLVIETLIAIRFVFKLFNAQATNVIVSTVYELSSIFVDPFAGIVQGDWQIGRFYIDVDALIALAIFMLLAFVTIEVIKVFSPPSALE